MKVSENDIINIRLLYSEDKQGFVKTNLTEDENMKNEPDV